MYGLDFIFERSSFINSNGLIGVIFEKIFVFDVVAAIFTIGDVLSDESRSGPGWFENRLDSGSGWVLSFYR